jgi:uncharacterized membrane-anchored protein
VETVTIAASRSSSLGVSETQLLVGSVVLIVVLAWMLLARIRRDRHEPHA